MLLQKSFSHNNQSIELHVKYDPATNIITEIKSIWLVTHGKIWPVGDLLMHLFEPAINKLIDETDWRAIYREFMEYDGVLKKAI